MIAEIAPRQDIARLRAETDIADIIRETVLLTCKGRLLSGLCPFHAERTPSLYVYTDHYHCFGCGAHGDVLDWLIRARGMTFPQAVARLGGTARPLIVVSAPTQRIDRGDAAPTDAGQAANVEAARRIWRDAVCPRGTSVERYLHHRGVRLPDAPVIRWHPSCPRTGGTLPAMVALMTDPVSGQATGVHRTFLLPDGRGKALVEKPKMMLGKAGVIRLADDDDIGEGLGLAEGIETALSVMQVIGLGPVWAAGSSTGMAGFPVLPRHTLTLFADSGGPGADAAAACANRWRAAGREARIYAPRTARTSTI